MSFAAAARRAADGGPGATDAFERAGDEIGPYHLIARLGEGGLRTV